MSDLLMVAGFMFSVWGIAAGIDTGRDQYLLMVLAGSCVIASVMAPT